MSNGDTRFVFVRSEGFVRRSILFCALGLVGVMLCGPPVAAQVHSRFAAGADAQQPGWSAFKHPGSSSHDHGNRHDRGGGHHRHHDRGTTWLFWGSGYPLLWGGGYEAIYPYSVQRGFGVWTPTPVPATIPRVVDPPAPAVAPKTAKKLKVRKTNAASKARAGKFIGYGDKNFEKQSYLSAVERYKAAARAAPDVAEAYFRQGFGFVAMGNYTSAAKAFRRGLGIRSDWSDSPFRLDKIYGDNRLVKTAHLESLAMAVEANPLDADLLMLLGLQMFFDGQAERSEVFFARVAQLGGNEDQRLDGFLPRPGPAGAPKPDRPAKPVGKVVF